MKWALRRRVVSLAFTMRDSLQQAQGVTMQRVTESEQEYRGGKSGVKYLFRGPKLDWGVILLLPGERLGEHFHNEVEETFYVLEGQIACYANGVRHALAAGDAVRFEAPEHHDMANESERPARMVFIKHPYMPKDKVDVRKT
jgi:quercetin dioxygenase-like cupin family protein